MSAEMSSRPRRFRTSSIAVLSAVCLVGSVQALVTAAQEPLRPAVFYVVNWVIVHGRWGAIPISGPRPVWIGAVQALGIAAVALGLGLTLAHWNSRKALS